MVRHFAYIADYRQQRSENPGIQRGMREAAHIHHLAGECVAEVGWMQRIDLGMHCHRQVLGVVALDWMVEERNTEERNERED